MVSQCTLGQPVAFQLHFSVVEAIYRIYCNALKKMSLKYMLSFTVPFVLLLPSGVLLSPGVNFAAMLYVSPGHICPQTSIMLNPCRFEYIFKKTNIYSYFIVSQQGFISKVFVIIQKVISPITCVAQFTSKQVNATLLHALSSPLPNHQLVWCWLWIRATFHVFLESERQKRYTSSLSRKYDIFVENN